jgi:Major Facilitator Superfamily
MSTSCLISHINLLPISIFLFVGLVTTVSAPFIYWKLDNNVATARFLTEHERVQAVERLRANQTGVGSRELKWSHVLEATIEPKTYFWIGMSLLLNVGAAVTAIFGPLILSGFGFDRYITSLLNIPFGVVQTMVIFLASYATQTSRLKFPILIALILPVVAGLAMLYVLPRTNSNQGALLTAYYLLAFLYGGIPVVISWIIGNTAGSTKKSVIMSFYNAGASAGNIIGPLLFNSRDAPSYHPGLRAVLAIFVTFVVVVLIQAANLLVLNRLQARTRIANGKKAVFHDRSMDEHYGGSEEGFGVSGVSGEPRLGDNAFLDLTDRKNDEFLYIY